MSRILLIVAHGSRSSAWNHAIETFCSNLQQAVHGQSGIEEISWCYLEHAQPDIPSALERHCRGENRVGEKQEIIALPLFLSVGQHVSSDIPKEFESIAIFVERRGGMAIYECRGRRIVLLDPPPTLDLLADNIERRIKRLNVTMNGNGIVVVFYGAKEYLRQWNHLAFHVQSKLLERFPHTQVNWGYGGEAVDFSPAPLAGVFREMAQNAGQIVVIPALAAVGIVQNEVIPAAIELSLLGDRIAYSGDAILPDSEMERLALDYVCKHLD
jgi:sirohydrochlorin ferrochelatase